MVYYNPRSIRGKAVPAKRMTGGAFLFGSLGGLQEAEGIDSAYSGKGLGMGMPMPMSSTGSGMSSINKKLEQLMIKQSKPKQKNIKFTL